MQPLKFPDEALAQSYTIALTALGEIAEAYYSLGSLDDARHVLRTALQFAEEKGVPRQTHLKLVLQYAKTLVVNYFLTNQDAGLVFSAVLHARQLAEAAQDQQSSADALSLLGQAHYYGTFNASATLTSQEGTYQEALDYHQQALERREALQDTRGISESLFFIGLVHERGGAHDLAHAYYSKALHVADHHGHSPEKAEPARHLAGLAWVQGNLDQALTFALQALTFRKAAGFQPFLPFDHLLIGDIYLARGDAANALLYAQQANALAKVYDQKRALVFSLLSLGDIQVAQKEVSQARDRFEEALAIGWELQIPLAITRAGSRLERLARE